jgi:methanethiol S-methyltransferase
VGESAGPAEKLVALTCAAVAFAGMGALAALVVLLGLGLMPERAALPLPWPWVVNAGWLLLFGVQHSGMARPQFKARWTNLVPAHLERSAYAALSGAILLGLALTWQDLPVGELWRLPLGFEAVALLGALGVLLVARWFDGLGLLGFRQVWEQGRPVTADNLLIVGPYRFVRHPMQAAALVFLWGHPVMPVTLAALSGGLTLYVLVGLQFEERDLLAKFGPAYAAYRGRVPMLVPWRRPAAPATHPPLTPA